MLAYSSAVQTHRSTTPDTPCPSWRRSSFCRPICNGWPLDLKQPLRSERSTNRHRSSRSSLPICSSICSSLHIMLYTSPSYLSSCLGACLLLDAFPNHPCLIRSYQLNFSLPLQSSLPFNDSFNSLKHVQPCMFCMFNKIFAPKQYSRKAQHDRCD